MAGEKEGLHRPLLLSQVGWVKWPRSTLPLKVTQIMSASNFHTSQHEGQAKHTRFASTVLFAIKM